MSSFPVMSDPVVEVSVPMFFTAGGELGNSDGASFGVGTKGCGEGEATYALGPTNIIGAPGCGTGKKVPGISGVVIAVGVSGLIFGTPVTSLFGVLPSFKTVPWEVGI